MTKTDVLKKETQPAASAAGRRLRGESISLGLPLEPARLEIDAITVAYKETVGIASVQQ